MLISTILVIAALAFLALGSLWSIWQRGLRKTRVRLIGIVASLVVSIVITVVLRSTVLTSLDLETVLAWVGAKLDPMLMELLSAAPSLRQIVFGAAAGLVTPIVFFLIFIVLNFISWIVYLVISLTRGAVMKEKDANSPFALPRTIASAVAQTLIILMVWLVPIAAYAGVAPGALEAVSESEVLDDGTQQVVDMVLDDYVKPLDNNAVVNVFRVFGGRAITDAMMNFQVDGTTVVISEELETLADIACHAMTLMQKDFANYGSEQESALVGIVDAFGDSHVLPTAAGEVVHSATGAWMNDETFIGLDKTFVYIDASGMFDDFTDTLLEILYNDSEKGNEQALCNDLRTTADILGVLIRSDVFSSLGESDAMVGALSQSGVVNSVVTVLGSNSSMKVLIPEITNIGVRSIASTLGVKENVASVYDDMMDDIALGLNNAKGKTGDAQINAVTDVLVKSFDDAGMAVDREVVESYSATMITDIIEESGDAEITPDTVKGFFALYAWSVEEATKVEQSAIHNSTEALGFGFGGDWKNALKGTVYENMTEAQLKSSGPAILARMNLKLSEITEDTEPSKVEQIRKEAESMIVNEYGDRLNASAMTALIKATAEITVSNESIKATASMQSPAEMAKETHLITLDLLLLDVKIAADSIDPEMIANEAAAIETVFSAAQKLLAETGGKGDIKLDTVAASVGLILDQMGGTGFFGEEKAGDLFTAVMQSETVRTAADINVITATKLADAGKPKEGEKLNYEQTFTGISQSVTIMENMNKNNGELSDEDIEEMIRNINPQTAGMLEVYVTPDRLENSYDVPANYADTAAPLLSNMFHYMSDADMDDAQYKKESKAINNIMTLTMAARDNAKDKDHNKTLFGADGILGKEARPALDDLMASKSLAYSLRETDFEEDPFDLSDLMHESEDRSEAEELREAIRGYYADHHDAETYQTLGLIAKLFGIGEITDILGE